MARQSIRLRCVHESSSELNQLLQHGFVFGSCEYEYNNAARHDGLELRWIRIVGWRRSAMSLHDSNQSLHVSSSHDSRTRNRYEFQHRNTEIKGEAAFVGLLQPLLDPIVIHITSFTLELRWTVGMSICRCHRFRLRKRSRGHVANSNVLTQSSLE